jgi:hypothetical protein
MSIGMHHHHHQKHLDESLLDRVLQRQRRKGNREHIAVIKDGKGRLLTDSIEKANSLNFCYSSVFGSECRIS